MGCATSSTSKIMIVGDSKRKGIDLEYEFGHVSIEND
jgi:2-methylaconitate cis-trans-isomerase PrpF